MLTEDVRFPVQRQMTITHSTANGTNVTLVPGSHAPQVPQGTQVGLDECQYMPCIVLQKRNTELKEFSIFIVSGKMLRQPSRLLPASITLRNGQGKE